MTSRLAEISAKMQDATVPVADLSRIISLEMADVLASMAESSEDPAKITVYKNLNAQLKGLRELQKSLSEADILSRKDVLNFEGPKFKFVFGQLVEMFKRALEESGVDKMLAQSVIRYFEDICRDGEDRLRKDTAKIGRKSK